MLSRSILPAAILALAVIGCSSDSTPTGGGGGSTDTTPPSISSVTAVDAYHFDVTFNEDVRKDTAEYPDHYLIVEGTTPLPALAAPGDTVLVATASLGTDKRTVSITTQQGMSAVPYDLSVSGVADVSGNEIKTPVTTSFTGSGDPDLTPPQIVYRSPAPNATGVPVGSPVIFQFSEPVSYASVQSGVTWTVAGGGSAVPFDLSSENSISFALNPSTLMATNTLYTVTLTGVQDFAVNVMPTTSWSFRTTPTADSTPPTLVSSTPADGATNVNVNTNLSLTFSEAVNQVTFDVLVVPDPGSGVATWSNGGKTVTFDPDLPLATNQQYTLTILPGSVEDLAGNGIASIVTINFTTGAMLDTGRIRGTIAGDPASATANDPTGALVGAADANPLATDNFNLLGSAIVAANDTYDIQHLQDGTFHIIAIMDSNGDGQLDPSTGDAIGLYGIDLGIGDLSPDSVTITGGNQVTGINFPLFDTSAVTGSVSYDGGYASGFYNAFVALFDTTAFDPGNVPDYGTTVSWPYNVEFRFDTFDNGLLDGTYYAAAYLDVNSNGVYDPNTDPAGIYGGVSPIPIHLENGNDVLGITIVMVDPVVVGQASPGVAWPVNRESRAPWFQRLSEKLRQLQTAQRR